MRSIFKRFFITLGALAFITVAWANRTGRLNISDYNWGGKITEISETTPGQASTIPVRLGIFAENAYDFNPSTQSFAAEGLVWAHWSSAFQELLDAEGVTIEQVINPVNRVNSWDWLMKPFYPKPLRSEGGNYYQLMRFAGRFYVDELDFHRFPFEQVTFPIAFGLNSMSDVFSAEKVRLIADRPQSGVGPFVDIVGYATDSVRIGEFVQTFPTSFGFKTSAGANSTDFSQVWLQISYKKSWFASVQQLVLPLLAVMLITLVAPNLAASLWDVRIAIPSTAILTLVFLQQSYRQTLPSLPYITFLDQIYAACYIVTFTLFCLFVWTSNKLDMATDGERSEVISRLNKIDSYVQTGCIIFLFGSVLLNWVFPIHGK